MNVAWRAHSRQPQVPTGHGQADECAYSASKDDAEKAASHESCSRRDITFAGAHRRGQGAEAYPEGGTANECAPTRVCTPYPEGVDARRGDLGRRPSAANGDKAFRGGQDPALHQPVRVRADAHVLTTLQPCQRARGTGPGGAGIRLLSVRDGGRRRDEPRNHHCQGGAVRCESYPSYRGQVRPNGSRLSCGALKKKSSFHILRAPSASSAC